MAESIDGWRGGFAIFLLFYRRVEYFSLTGTKNVVRFVLPLFSREGLSLTTEGGAIF